MSEAVRTLADYDTETRFEATVVSNERITPQESDEEVRELVLDVDRADLPYRGRPERRRAGARFAGVRQRISSPPVQRLGSPRAQGPEGKPRIKICVRRCSYIDEYSGEEYKGVASNYLCDLRSGESLTITGPFGLAFSVPEESEASLILIGTGTGIAPFRAFVKHMYKNEPSWKGRIWLLYGAKSGLEMLYMNDERDDFAQYYDEETFEAIKALSPRPHWAHPIAWDNAIAERGEELWKMLSHPETYVYVAGLEKMSRELDAVFERLAGSKQKWARRKAELRAGGRWVELLY